MFEKIIGLFLLFWNIILTIPFAQGAIGRDGIIRGIKLSSGVELLVYLSSFFLVFLLFFFPSLMMVSIKGHSFPFGYTRKAKWIGLSLSLFFGLLFTIYLKARNRALEYFDWTFLNPMTYVDFIASGINDSLFFVTFIILFMFIPVFMSFVVTDYTESWELEGGFAIFPVKLVPIYGFITFLFFIFSIFLS